MSSKISWTDETWNPVVGCSKISKGCKFCYAEKMAARLWSMGRGDYGSVLGIEDYKWNGKVFCRKGFLDKPLHWKKPRRIFVVSMGDLFHEAVPFEFIHKVFDITQQAWQHKYLILTKRVKQLSKFIETCAMHTKYGVLDKTRRGTRYHDMYAWPHNNVHLGVSISTQAEADEKIPILLQIPGKLWLSIEPFLEPIDYLASWLVGCSDKHLRPCSIEERLAKRDKNLRSISGVVIGAESIGGYPGRECKLEWVRDLVRQCDAVGVPVHIKQLHIGGKLEKDFNKFPAWGQRREYLK